MTQWARIPGALPEKLLAESTPRSVCVPFCGMVLFLLGKLTTSSYSVTPCAFYDNPCIYGVHFTLRGTPPGLPLLPYWYRAMFVHSCSSS
jgi:hypothetical protein